MRFFKDKFADTKAVQVQTTTIEISQTIAAGVNFQVKVYEQTTAVFCDCCADEATRTIAALRSLR